MYACEFRPRCAIEAQNSGDYRLGKIQEIIGECKFGIHDISIMDLDKQTNLPRFNMPFELALFLAARTFGSGHQRKKVALVFDEKHEDKYRYRAALSDLAGHDIEVRSNEANDVIKKVRDWLDSHSGKKSLPGGSHIHNQYQEFLRQLPHKSKEFNLVAEELTYNDLCRAMEAWLKQHF